MIIEKIGAQHRLRKAVLYIRQSSAQQVLHNRESQTLQYAMRERFGHTRLVGDRDHRRGSWPFG